MKFKILIVIAIMLVLNNKIKSQIYKKVDNGITCLSDSLEIKIQFFNSSIVRIVKTPQNKTFTKNSLSVIMLPEKINYLVDENDGELNIKSEKVQINLNPKNGKITFLNLNNKILLKEKEFGVSFIDFNDTGIQTFSVKQSFSLDNEEAIYGLGQQQNGKMIQRDLKLRMIQGNTDDYIPFFLSNKGYGVFWDNYSPTTFLDNENETSFNSDVGECIDYYFMYGEKPDGVIAEMRNLTGDVPMFPLWAYGYFQSRERYKTQDETIDVVRKYRELGVPIDGIIQDWQYWGNNYLWNAMDFLNYDFYDPQKMVNDVHNLNAHILISIWNSFGPKTKQYKDLDKIGALMNFQTWPLSGSTKWPPRMDYPSGVRVYDPFNPLARDIYWDYLNKGIFSLGMDGWWIDSSEPDHLNFKPEDLDNKTFLGSFRKVRNAFPLLTVGGVYDHQRSVTSDKRVFILTRSAFAGQQRYAANTWSGDVIASWEALKNQISAGLNFSICGIPYWNSDIGGFFLWSYPKKLDDANYKELYTRWLQFGAFTPMMRSHGTDAPREIYQFGKKGEKIYDAIEKSINLRYALLPYIYSSSWEVTSKQSTMMRALVMDFGKDKNSLDINDQYMFGKSILVAPVTKSMYSKMNMSDGDTNYVEDYNKTKSDEVYLPDGNNWIDFWTGERFSGGQTINKEAPIDILPLFIKAGSIIPIGPKVQYATEKNWDNLEIRIYEGSDCEFVLYEDENDNYNYEDGQYTVIMFKWDDKNNELIISNRKGSFNGMLEERKFNVIKVSGTQGIGINESKKFDKEIHYNGKKVITKI